MSSFIPETKGTGAYVHDDDRNSKKTCCICEFNESNAKIRVGFEKGTLPLRAVEQICHQDYFHDSTLLVVARRRILDVLMMADPAGGWNERSYQERYDEAKFRNLPLPKRKRRGKRVKVGDPQKLEILDAMAALGRACAEIRNFVDAREHYHKAKEGYEQQLPRNNEEVFEVTYRLVVATVMSN
ncbi:hypothetical protein TrLO_g14644 [Triparma laevis f. longispina]|uniref:Uncharacterized protein n=1 Tax=Triparma laevis f. longispina TaxID=1714387 RepID=A0A9W6ZG28_9STRA|nr:hypothetical protein TrLO_g14644 [Triparma laevis f. longispina]